MLLYKLWVRFEPGRDEARPYQTIWYKGQVSPWPCDGNGCDEAGPSLNHSLAFDCGYAAL